MSTCELCEDAAASIKCTTCEDEGVGGAFCADCSKQLHSTAKGKTHGLTDMNGNPAGAPAPAPATPAKPAATETLSVASIPVCGLCEDEPSAVHCKNCDENYCTSCSTDFHKPAKQQGHAFQTLILAGSAPAPSTPAPAAASATSLLTPNGNQQQRSMSTISPASNLLLKNPLTGSPANGAQPPRMSLSLFPSRPAGSSPVSTNLLKPLVLPTNLAKPAIVSPTLTAAPTPATAASTSSSSPAGGDAQLCSLCEDQPATKQCELCNNDVFCDECDGDMHMPTNKKSHVRKDISAAAKNTSIAPITPAPPTPKTQQQQQRPSVVNPLLAPLSPPMQAKPELDAAANTNSLLSLKRPSAIATIPSASPTDDRPSPAAPPPTAAAFNTPKPEPSKLVPVSEGVSKANSRAVSPPARDLPSPFRPATPPSPKSPTQFKKPTATTTAEEKKVQPPPAAKSVEPVKAKEEQKTPVTPAKPIVAASATINPIVKPTTPSTPAPRSSASPPTPATPAASKASIPSTPTTSSYKSASTPSNGRTFEPHPSSSSPELSHEDDATDFVMTDEEFNLEDVPDYILASKLKGNSKGNSRRATSKNFANEIKKQEAEAKASAERREKEEKARAALVAREKEDRAREARVREDRAREERAREERAREDRARAAAAAQKQQQQQMQAQQQLHRRRDSYDSHATRSRSHSRASSRSHSRSRSSDRSRSRSPSISSRSRTPPLPPSMRARGAPHSSSSRSRSQSRSRPTTPRRGRSRSRSVSPRSRSRSPVYNDHRRRDRRSSRSRTRSRTPPRSRSRSRPHSPRSRTPTPPPPPPPRRLRSRSRSRSRPASPRDRSRSRSRSRSSTPPRSRPHSRARSRTSSRERERAAEEEEERIREKIRMRDQLEREREMEAVREREWDRIKEQQLALQQSIQREHEALGRPPAFGGPGSILVRPSTATPATHRGSVTGFGGGNAHHRSASVGRSNQDRTLVEPFSSSSSGGLFRSGGARARSASRTARPGLFGDQQNLLESPLSQTTRLESTAEGEPNSNLMTQLLSVLQKHSNNAAGEDPIEGGAAPSTSELLHIARLATAAAIEQQQPGAGADLHDTSEVLLAAISPRGRKGRSRHRAHVPSDDASSSTYSSPPSARDKRAARDAAREARHRAAFEARMAEESEEEWITRKLHERARRKQEAFEPHSPVYASPRHHAHHYPALYSPPSPSRGATANLSASFHNALPPASPQLLHNHSAPTHAAYHPMSPLSPHVAASTQLGGAAAASYGPPPQLYSPTSATAAAAAAAAAASYYGNPSYSLHSPVNPNHPHAHLLSPRSPQAPMSPLSPMPPPAPASSPMPVPPSSSAHSPQVHALAVAAANAAYQHVARSYRPAAAAGSGITGGGHHHRTPTIPDDHPILGGMSMSPHAAYGAPQHHPHLSPHHHPHPHANPYAINQQQVYLNELYHRGH